LVKSGKLCRSLEEKRGGRAPLEEENMMDGVDECILYCVDISLKVKESHEFFLGEIFTFDKERERNSATC
jgi:hypothetical protein